MDKRTKEVAKKQISLLQAYQDVFSSREGHIILQDLMKNHHVKGSSFNPDPYVTAFNEGERNVVLRILTKLNIDMKELQKRMEEKDV